MQTRRQFHCPPAFFLALTVLAALGFVLTFYNGVHGLSAPPWGNIVLAALPALVFFLFWRRARRGRWNNAAALAVTLVLAAAFALGGMANLLWIGLEALDQPIAERPRTAAGDRRVLREMTDLLQVPVRHGEIVLYENTHGGFHGDGETFCTVVFDTGDAPEKDMARSGVWHPLPLTGSLTAVAYGLSVQENGVQHCTGPMAVNGDGECYFPSVENGCYYFHNRSSAASPWDDSALPDCAAYNFTLAIYDADNSALYYYELDT